MDAVEKRQRLLAEHQKNPKKFDKLDTKFGVVTVLERKNEKITVLIDEDITATFNEKEFLIDFVL